MGTLHSYSSGWRDKTRHSTSIHWKTRLLRGVSLFIFFAGVVAVACVVFFGAIPWLSEQTGQAGLCSSDEKGPPVVRSSSRGPAAIAPLDLGLNPEGLTDRMVVENDGQSFIVESSIDSDLQDYVTGLLQKSHTVRAAVVVLKPDDGRVLAMAGYDTEGNGDRLCLEANSPAASLFKIVAAAAALEHAGFTPEKKVFFEGYKYSLYKRQLKQTKGRYSTETSFKEAFGASINPVFGKLGIYDLGQELMSDSAERFFFNRSIPFDFPVDRSRVHVPEDDFGLAEIASGYNKRTVISPLHAALLASAVANDGVMMRPWVVKRILQKDGKVVYRGKPSRMADAVSKETAERLRVMMQETVKHGTCQRSFYRLRVNKAFKDVELGAKTGSMGDVTGRFRYEWLTAYAIPSDGTRSICVAVMGVHGEKLGIKAGELGRIIINHYLSS